MSSRVVIESDDDIKVERRHRCCTRPGRLNLVIDPELKEWAHAYASRKHTTLTNIVTDHLVALRDNELPKRAPKPTVSKKVIKDALLEALEEIFGGKNG